MKKQAIIDAARKWSDYGRTFHSPNLIYTYHTEEVDGKILIIPDWHISEIYPPSPCAVLDPNEVISIKPRTKGKDQYWGEIHITLKNHTRYSLHVLEPILDQI